MDDVQTLLESNPGGGLDPVMKSGGVIQLASIGELPEQFNTPCLGIMDGGASTTHFSGKVRWITFNVIVAAYVSIFDQVKKVKGKGPETQNADKSAGLILKLVRTVLDYNRIDDGMGAFKYARAFFRSEDSVALVRSPQESEFMLAKSASFEYIRAEQG